MKTYRKPDFLQIYEFSRFVALLLYGRKVSLPPLQPRQRKEQKYFFFLGRNVEYDDMCM